MNNPYVVSFTTKIKGAAACRRLSFVIGYLSFSYCNIFDIIRVNVLERKLVVSCLILIFTFSNAQERDKFEIIYERYKKLMLHKAYGILRDYMLAEDAVSEALIRIYKNLHKIDDPTSGRCAAFVVTIVKNTALTILEKENKTTLDLDEYSEVLSDEQDVENLVLSDISTERIHILLDNLSEELRAVFVLRYAYDLSHKEISELLGISENNVTVRFHRARQKLLGILIKEGYACEAK